MSWSQFQLDFLLIPTTYMHLNMPNCVPVWSFEVLCWEHVLVKMAPKKNEKNPMSKHTIYTTKHFHLRPFGTHHVWSHNSCAVSSAAENFSLEHLWSITGKREDHLKTSTKPFISTNTAGTPMCEFYTTNSVCSLRDWWPCWLISLLI